MTENVGSLDRAARAILGLVLIAMPLLTSFALFESAVFFYGAIIVGLVFVATAALKFCPIYSIVGIRTCRV